MRSTATAWCGRTSELVAAKFLRPGAWGRVQLAPVQVTDTLLAVLPGRSRIWTTSLAPDSMGAPLLPVPAEPEAARVALARVKGVARDLP